jgi:hypothetical protein
MHAFLQTLVRRDMVSRPLRLAITYGDVSLIVLAVAVLAAACCS